MNKIISTNQAPEAIGPYSQAVSANGMLFGSGQIPIDPATGTLVSGGIEEQTRQVLDNIKAVLEAEGLTLDCVVRTECFMADMEEFAALNAVYAEYFSHHPPARSCVQVARLPKDARVEIAFTAVYP